MIVATNMIIIGSAARNVGKTEFACQLISQAALEHQVVGVKVTTIDESGLGCPRGGKGCGVCASVTGEFEIVKEVNADGGKDTSRLLRAGASEVFWLRVRRPYLRKGVEALFAELPVDCCVVCESNSLRSVVAPGLFIIIKEENSQEMKPSCRAVRQFCDRVISFDGRGWDLPPEKIRFFQNHWEINK